METPAIWDLFSTRGIPAEDACTRASKVIADDFIIVGFGNTEEQAAADHDENLMAFLKRCKERCLQLNASKIRLRLPFIGHVATAQGLQVDPHKVHAVLEMPTSEYVAAVQRLLGFVQYQSKFMPHLSDLTKRTHTKRNSLVLGTYATGSTGDN